MTLVEALQLACEFLFFAEGKDQEEQETISEAIQVIDEEIRRLKGEEHER